MNAIANWKDLYRSLDFERPLDVAVLVDLELYVPDLHTSEGNNPVDELRTQIEMSERPSTWLFTGHRGVGKSTELRRLKKELEDQGFFVILADVNSFLNLAEPISIETLLLSIVATLADGLTQALGTTIDGQSAFARFKHFLTQTEVHLGDIQLGDPANGGSATLALKTTPHLMERVKQAFAGSTAKLAGQVQQFAQQVAEEIRAKRQMPCVLLLDSLEQLRVTGSDAQICYDAILRTFDTNAAFLKLEHIHVVYSVPPYLPFLVPRLGTYFGVEICTLPHVKVFQRPTAHHQASAAQDCDAGLQLMQKCLRNRYPMVGQLLSTEQINTLARASSGSMRDFLRLLRSVCSKAQTRRLVTADEDSLRRAQQALRNEIQLTEDDKTWLRKVRASCGHSLQNLSDLPHLARLFDNGIILNYRNGEDWCDVHYLLHDQLQAEPSAAGSAASPNVNPLSNAST